MCDQEYRKFEEVFGLKARLQEQSPGKLLLQEADERIAQLSEVKGAGLSAAGDSVVGREGAFGGPDPGPFKPSHDAPRPLDPLTQGVYELADTGRSPLEIAQQMDEQVGKVELILALRDA